VPGVDFSGVATDLGVEGERVERAEELPSAAERAVGGGRPYLLDVIADPKVPKFLS
jgi:thiamine pyrophosphate-dependent acetolactate synthase large subunit-like protein